MKNRILAVMAVVLMAFFAVGCDDDSSGGSTNGGGGGNSDGGTVTPEQLADGFIDAMCTKLMECCENGVDFGSGQPATTKEECVSSAGAQMLRNEILQDLKDPKVIFHAEAASACLGQVKHGVEQSTCEDGYKVDNPVKEIPECLATVEGTVDEGGACDKDVQCKGELHCVKGTCTAPKDVGEACEDDDECKTFRCDGGKCASTDDATDVGMGPWNDMCYEEGAQG